MDSSHSTKESGHIAIPPMTGSKSEKAVDPPPVTAATTQQPPLVSRWKSDLGIFDFILRIAAAAAAVAAAVTMGVATQQPSFFTGFFDQLKADYNYVDRALTFFVFANLIAAAYLVLSLPFSIMCFVRPDIIGSRLVLLGYDAVPGVYWVTSATVAAAIAIFFAHNGSLNANSVAICQHFDESCRSVSVAVVASFITALIFVILVYEVAKKKN